MAREDLHFRLRIPEDLKQKIQQAAEANRRSMTAEIIARLEASLDAPAVDPMTLSLHFRHLVKSVRELQKIVGQIEEQNMDMRGDKERREMIERLGEIELLKMEEARQKKARKSQETKKSVPSSEERE